MLQSLTTIKSWFTKGAYPTQAQFADTWDSFWHKSEQIAMNAIQGLSSALNLKADLTYVNTKISLAIKNVSKTINIIGTEELPEVNTIVFDGEDTVTTILSYMIQMADGYVISSDFQGLRIVGNEIEFTSAVSYEGAIVTIIYK